MIHKTCKIHLNRVEANRLVLHTILSSTFPQAYKRVIVDVAKNNPNVE